MDNFRYYTPTEVIFGKEVEKETGETAKKYGIRPLSAEDVNRIYHKAIG